MKKGFTLLELMIVVVLVGILAAFGVVGYFGAVDKARNEKARRYLGLIAQAQKMCHEEEGDYGVAFVNTPPSQVACGANQVLGNFIEELGAIPSDSDWNYSMVVTVDPDSFVITATKADGSCTITVDENNNWVNGC